MVCTPKHSFHVVVMYEVIGHAWPDGHSCLRPCSRRSLSRSGHIFGLCAHKSRRKCIPPCSCIRQHHNSYAAEDAILRAIFDWQCSH